MWRDSRNTVVVHHSGKYTVVVLLLDWDKHPYSWSWEKQARSMHCHSHGDLCCVLGAVAAETDLNAGDSVSFLLQLELNQAVVD